MISWWSAAGALLVWCWSIGGLLVVVVFVVSLWPPGVFLAVSWWFPSGLLALCGCRGLLLVSTCFFASIPPVWWVMTVLLAVWKTLMAIVATCIFPSIASHRTGTKGIVLGILPTPILPSLDLDQVNSDASVAS